METKFKANLGSRLIAVSVYDGKRRPGGVSQVEANTSTNNTSPPMEKMASLCHIPPIFVALLVSRKWRAMLSVT